MTARSGKPPLSRRELRGSAPAPFDSDSDASTDAATDPDSVTPNATPITHPGGRRARWDPSAESADGAASTAPGQDVDSASESVPFRERDFRPEGRRASFAPAFIAGDAQGTEDAAPSEVGAADRDGSGSRDGDGDGDPRADIDLAAPERTMTRRELRILRARAEAAGMPAPDIMFLPNGESTVTGAIPVLDGVAFSGPTEALGESRDETTSESGETSQAARSKGGEFAPEGHGPDSSTGSSDVAPTADAAGVVTEQPVADADLHPGSDASAAGEVTDVAATPAVIPALVEPDPGASARFPMRNASDADDTPAEIVVDAEPATGDHPVSTAAVTSTDQAAVADPSAPPAPGSLRPFDAMFLPPSIRDGDDDGVPSGVVSESAAPPLDTASAQPANDTDGLRGDILAAPAGAARPFGHWSTQNDEDDEPTAESALSRDVGTGVLTTHALVLPSVPDAGEPLMSPLTSTGEVMVTGMVELPKSFGSTGAHPALFDHPEVDSLIDDADREDADSSAAPIRATRAVSSTTTTRSMVEAAPAKHSRTLAIWGVAIGAVLVVGVALWAIGRFVFNAF